MQTHKNRDQETNNNTSTNNRTQQENNTASSPVFKESDKMLQELAENYKLDQIIAVNNTKNGKSNPEQLKAKQEQESKNNARYEAAFLEMMNGNPVQKKEEEIENDPLLKQLKAEQEQERKNNARYEAAFQEMMNNHAIQTKADEEEIQLKSNETIIDHSNIQRFKISETIKHKKDTSENKHAQLKTPIADKNKTKKNSQEDLNDEQEPTPGGINVAVSMGSDAKHRPGKLQKTHKSFIIKSTDNGQELLKALEEATTEGGYIAVLTIYAHGWAENGQCGIRGTNTACGFRTNESDQKCPEIAKISELGERMNKKIRFSPYENSPSMIYIGACHTADPERSLGAEILEIIRANGCYANLIAPETNVIPKKNVSEDELSYEVHNTQTDNFIFYKGDENIELGSKIDLRTNIHFVSAIEKFNSINKV